MSRYVKPADGLRVLWVLAGTLALACGSGPIPEGSETDAGPTRGESAPRAVATLPAPELSRGRYLVDAVLLCANCHSQRDWTLYSGPVVVGSEWLGGTIDEFLNGTPAPAISAEALNDWGVDDLVRALTDGLTPAGDTIHRQWMLTNLADLRPEDAHAVARYLKSRPDPDVEPESHSAASGTERGAYLVSIGRCVLCHGEDLAGGKAVAVPGGPSVPSANITIDAETGIGRMTRAEFIDYFKSLSEPDFARIPVPENTPNTAMAWPQLSQMTREDLGAIYDYIETLPPVERVVGQP